MNMRSLEQDPAATQKKRNNRNPPSRPPLFEDTSSQQAPYGYPNEGYPPNSGPNPYGQQPPNINFPGGQLLNDPMASMAMQYGSSLADQGKEYMHKNIEKYVSTSKLKYYFAVDTSYVGKKLTLLLFPYSHTDWSIHFSPGELVAPKDELNAPDLYIPVMALVTYILTAGVVMGIQNRFTPEQLGIQASSALVWLILELFIVMLSLYILNLNTGLKYLDTLAYSGYKYVGMIVILLAGLLFKKTGYYFSLLWFTFSTAYFLVKTLRIQILPHADSDGFTRGSKRSLYFILSISLLQPILMGWLTYHIIFPH
ncbi:protein YIF1B-A isoform X2 [Octopus bimaculoides]|uniref:protein YIF1B-A isoform X2 n=1 Tax=Octopus bimaculoides TaxID=37653 RepID=UPI0022E7210A|nr:protein YIF1B-A isoform X2 [Octopus bimaculoides]